MYFTCIKNEGCLSTLSGWQKRKHFYDVCRGLYFQINGKSKNTRMFKNYSQCMNEFEIHKYRADQSIFRSQLCAYQFRDKAIGYKNEQARKTVAYKTWRKSIFERDNSICQTCYQRSGYIHADHTKPFSLYLGQRLGVSNSRILCIPCHKENDTCGRKDTLHNYLAVGAAA